MFEFVFIEGVISTFQIPKGVELKHNKLINNTNKEIEIISNIIIIDNSYFYKIKAFTMDIKFLGVSGREHSLTTKYCEKISGNFKLQIALKRKTSYILDTFFKLEPENNPNYTEFAILTKNLVLNNKEKLESLLKKMENKNNVFYVGDYFTKKNISRQFDIIDINFYELPYIEYILEHYHKRVKIEFLFIESFWDGNDSSWYFSNDNKKYAAITRLIYLFKSRNYKVIFYNKEDPHYFKHFLPIATKCTHVITIDNELVLEYKSFGIKNVLFMPFFIDTQIFNFKDDEQNPKAFFAGGYYPKFVERSVFMEKNFKLINEKIGLDIFDRYIDEVSTPNKFPPIFNNMIVGGNLDIEDLIEVTKNHLFCINLNSVTTSNTMVARRIIEQLALGKIIISNYSKALENIGFENVVYDKDNEINKIFEKIKLLDISPANRKRVSEDVISKYSAENFCEKLLSFLESANE